MKKAWIYCGISGAGKSPDARSCHPMTPETAILLAAFAFFLVIAWAARTAARSEDAEERERGEKYAAMRREMNSSIEARRPGLPARAGSKR